MFLHVFQSGRQQKSGSSQNAACRLRAALKEQSHHFYLISLLETCFFWRKINKHVASCTSDKNIQAHCFANLTKSLAKR